MPFSFPARHELMEFCFTFLSVDFPFPGVRLNGTIIGRIHQEQPLDSNRIIVPALVPLR